MKRLSLARIAPLLIVALSLAACSREPVNLAGRMNAALTPPRVIADWIIEGRNDFMLFDLRSPADFAKGHLPNAVQVDAAKLRDRGVVRALPDYKKLVFYGNGEQPSAEVLEPLFARGLHVMILEGGYGGWQRAVLTEPPHATTPEEAKRVAVAKYFRGESALGTPEPLKNIPAAKYLRPAQLPAAKPAPTYESEGC
ncbi:MAG TPA: rhodanese-like domain-containing protein [bacterium]|nr:rhodanese-like domain-containing protein [bacterium]